MDPLVIMITIILFAIVDSFMVCCFIYEWVKRKTIEEFFPEWKSTHKKYWWTICWSILLYLNCVIISFAYVNLSQITYAILLIVGIVYCLLLGIIYIIIKHNIRYYYNRKHKK